MSYSGLGLDLPIYLEPGLFEWLGWYRTGSPCFLTPHEYRECGFNVVVDAPIVWPESRFNMDETTEQYYDRCHFVTKEILSRHEAEGKRFIGLSHGFEIKQLDALYHDFYCKRCENMFCSLLDLTLLIKVLCFIVLPAVVCFNISICGC